MTAEGAMAAIRLIDLCEIFHLPIVSLTDQAGMSIGSMAERLGTIRNGARAITAIYQARVPQAELVLRRAFGVGGAGAVNRHRANRSWCWPSGTWGPLPAQGGIEAAFRAELATVPDREAAIARIARHLQRIGSPFRTAEHFWRAGHRRSAREPGAALRLGEGRSSSAAWNSSAGHLSARAPKQDRGPQPWLDRIAINSLEDLE